MCFELAFEDCGLFLWVELEAELEWRFLEVSGLGMLDPKMAIADSRWYGEAGGCGRRNCGLSRGQSPGISTGKEVVRRIVAEG